MVEGRQFESVENSSGLADTGNLHWSTVGITTKIRKNENTLARVRRRVGGKHAPKGNNILYDHHPRHRIWSQLAVQFPLKGSNGLPHLLYPC